MHTCKESIKYELYNYRLNPCPKAEVKKRFVYGQFKAFNYYSSNNY